MKDEKEKPVVIPTQDPIKEGNNMPHYTPPPPPPPPISQPPVPSKDK